MKTKQININLPDWVQNLDWESATRYPSAEKKMQLVIELAQKNIHKQTGGPFAAAVFDEEQGRLIALGVNMVTTLGYSFAHAEIMAITQAQAILRNYNLSGPGMPSCVLVSSTEPCAMCLGAIPWSGIKTLICGAKDEDARAVGFDEGSKREDWVHELEKRGIRVIQEILRSEAAKVLLDYTLRGGIVY